MQVFIVGTPFETAESLDRLRLRKQCIESHQIMSAINGAKGWKNHPVVKMYAEHYKWLDLYTRCLEAYMRGETGDAWMLSQDADKCRPEFHTEAFFEQMKRRLYTKAPSKYAQWAELGKSEDNWYFVGGEWRIYRGGRRILGWKFGE